MNDQLYENINDRMKSKITEIEDGEELNIDDFKKGIISIHSKWSGKSIIYGKNILKFLEGKKYDNYQIKIIDIDTISKEKQIELTGGICHGYFESIWIENGKVEFKYKDNNNGTEISKFKDFLSQKLE